MCKTPGAKHQFLKKVLNVNMALYVVNQRFLGLNPRGGAKATPSHPRKWGAFFLRKLGREACAAFFAVSPREGASSQNFYPIIDVIKFLI
jgi:hypothetical protein